VRSRVARTSLALACVGLLEGSAPPTHGAPAQLGLTRKNAIQVCEPRGERAYLDRLRCSDGTPPTYSRSGSVGRRTKAKNPREDEEASAQNLGGKRPEAGGPDFHVVDLYRVTCSGRTQEIYLDMYHCDQTRTQLPAAGFHFAEE
jgi:hypothetical protein